MATATADSTAQNDAEGAQEVPKKKLSGRKLVLFIVLPLLLLLGGVGAVLGLGLLGGESQPAEEAEAKPQEKPGPTKPAVFFDLPEMLVNLNAKGKRPSFLKIKVSLEVGSQEEITRLQPLAPRIVDNFQVYLRELRAEDLRGSAGMARLREELLRRVNIATRPVEVRDVLFREMLVQ